MACNTMSDVPVRSCKVSVSPKPFSKADFFQLLFVPNSGLQKVVMIGKDITDDLYGSSGKADYSKLKKALTKKYGDKFKSFEYIGLDLYDESDEFYQCLAYSGCGSHSSFWIDGLNGTIVLSLNGLSRGKGFLKLVYESKDWSRHLDEMKNDQDSINDDSL